MNRSVCICIPVYNSKITIARTLNSLINQTYDNIIIHVVDNASTDNTVEIVKSVDDHRIIINTNDKHLPKSEYNWNRCFSHMQPNGYSSIFHGDDIYYPKMIEKQVDILETHENVGAVFTGSQIIDENDKLISTTQLPPTLSYNKELTHHDIIQSTLLHGNQLMTPSALYRSNIYRLMQPFNYEAFGYSSDLDMWLRTSKIWNLFVINEPLMAYRKSKYQDSKKIHTLRTSEEMFFHTVDYHIMDNKKLSQSAVDMYEMRRVEDKIQCLKNTVKSRGLRFPKVVMQGLLAKMGYK
jgi:glycosyltransferase involved in cell wall biosynthesis